MPGVAPPPKNSELEGDGAGNMDPEPPGVSPLRIPDSLGVRPVRRWGLSKEREFELLVGPCSMAGESGPLRNDDCPGQKPPDPRGAGDVIAATGGRSDFGVASGSVLPGWEFVANDCSNGFGS